MKKLILLALIVCLCACNQQTFSMPDELKPQNQETLASTVNITTSGKIFGIKTFDYSSRIKASTTQEQLDSVKYTMARDERILEWLTPYFNHLHYTGNKIPQKVEQAFNALMPVLLNPNGTLAYDYQTPEELTGYYEPLKDVILGAKQ